MCVDLKKEPDVGDSVTDVQDVDEQKRKFLLQATAVLGGMGALAALTPFLKSWLPNAKTNAESGLMHVDLSTLQPGQQLTLTWRGKPIWVLRRTPAMLATLASHEHALRDPKSLVPQQPLAAKNQYRSLYPEFLVLIGVCTHLGCIPKLIEAEDEQNTKHVGEFYCPCHGSRFDLAGRVFKGSPAPINLGIPPHHFINTHTLVLGKNAIE